MAKITDRQHKKMIAMYAECQNYSFVAKVFGVSVSTARRHINGDAETTKKVQHKKAENMAAVLEHMSHQKNKICGLLDRLIEAMDDPVKMDCSTLPQLATALGILVDKYTANEAFKTSDAKENNLFEAITAAGKEVDLSAIPELQSETASDTSMVDETGVQE